MCNFFYGLCKHYNIYNIYVRVFVCIKYILFCMILYDSSAVISVSPILLRH